MDLNKFRKNAMSLHYPSPKIRKSFAVFCLFGFCLNYSASAEDFVGETTITTIHGDRYSLSGKKTDFENIITIINQADPDLSRYESFGERFTGKTTTTFIIKDKSRISATGDVRIINTASHVNIGNNNALYVQGDSQVDINGKNVLIVALPSTISDEFLIDTKDAAISAKNGNNSVSVAGQNVQIIGQIDIESGSHVDLKLNSSNSFWYGSLNGSGLSLTLENGGRWIYDKEKFGLSDGGSHKLDTLILNNGGIVVLAENEIVKSIRSIQIDDGSGEIKTLPDSYIRFENSSKFNQHDKVEISTLKGTGGIFQVDLEWGNQENTDFITIHSVEDSGSTQLVAFDTSTAHLEEMPIGERIYFARVENGDTTFETNVDGEYNSAADLYTFNFATIGESRDGLTDWYLTKTGIGRTNENVTLLKDAVLVSYSLATDLDRFHERRGEARYANGASDGLWVRYRFSNIGFDDAFDMDKNMFQIGFDRDVSTSGSRKIVGVAFDYTQANTDLLGFTGSGDNERYGLNFYYTLLADCGGYADFTAKIGRIGNDYGAQNSNGADIGADFWQTYYGIGAEFGYKYEFKNNVFIEPQAQLQIVHIEDASFTSNSGIEADIDNMNSIIGRLGFRAGYSFDSVAENQKNTVYLLADVMHEFDGDSNIYAIGASMPYSDESSGSDTWYDVGIGTNLMLSNNSKLWLDTKHIFGGIYNSSWQINAGINITF